MLKPGQSYTVVFNDSKTREHFVFVGNDDKGRNFYKMRTPYGYVALVPTNVTFQLEA